MIFYFPKYTNWYGPYHLVDTVRFIAKKIPVLSKMESMISDDTYDYVSENIIPNKPFQIIDEIKRNLPFNKPYIKIHAWDTWSMDHTLAKIVVPMLKQLKETKHGIPSEFVNDRDAGNTYKQMSFDFCYDEESEKAEKDSFDIACKKWDEILDSMIWSFEQLLEKDTEDAFFEPYWEDMTEEEVEEYIRKVEEKDNGLGFLSRDPMKKKINQKKYEEYYSKMNIGFQNFGKYYTSLWD